MLLHAHIACLDQSRCLVSTLTGDVKQHHSILRVVGSNPCLTLPNLVAAVANMVIIKGVVMVMVMVKSVVMVVVMVKGVVMVMVMATATVVIVVIMVMVMGWE